MKELSARTPKQLDICLRMLYAENVAFSVEVTETDKRKIAYIVRIMTDDKTASEIEEKYRILTS